MITAAIGFTDISTNVPGSMAESIKYVFFNVCMIEIQIHNKNNCFHVSL